MFSELQKVTEGSTGALDEAHLLPGAMRAPRDSVRRASTRALLSASRVRTDLS